MDKGKLKSQLPSQLLGISEKCVAVALAVAGVVVGSQAVSATVPATEVASTVLAGPAVAGSSAILLTPASLAAGQQVADHESHSSHASHASHSSHASHVSSSQ